MKFKSLVPSIIFFISVLYLTFSSLTISKAISSQTEIFSIFIKGLAEKDVLLALFDSLSYMFFEIILPLLPFLLLTALGFLALFLFEIEPRFFFTAQLLFLLAAFFLSNFSTVILLTYLGILFASFILIKTFEPSKKRFLTGSSLISRGLRFVNIFFTIGLFFGLYLNFQSYQGLIIQSNAALIRTFVPDLTQFQKFQSEFINKTADELKQSIQKQYEQIPSEAKEQCKPVYDSIITGIEDYKVSVNERMQAQKAEDVQEELMRSFPIIEQTIKATPLFLAIALFALLEILRPFISAFFGAIYSLKKK